jgi:hypothetical protein
LGDIYVLWRENKSYKTLSSMACRISDNGWKEGVARTMSQACTYMMDVQKSLIQIHGKQTHIPFSHIIHAFQKGVLQSSLTAGCVYGAYFHIYKSCNDQPYANALATFVTSLLKIPISNSMRLIQLTPHETTNLISAGRKIIKNQGVRGLYNGYGLSFIEDFIEMELRDRLFQWVELWCIQQKLPIRQHEIGFIGGAIAGASVAFLTTPFDTLRCHLAYQSGTITQQKVNVLYTISTLLSQQGCQSFYRGANIRATSTGIRMALFYMFMKVL